MTLSFFSLISIGKTAFQKENSCNRKYCSLKLLTVQLKHVMFSLPACVWHVKYDSVENRLKSDVGCGDTTFLDSNEE